MISQTPLVGAPSRLSNLLKQNGVTSKVMIFKDYPNHLKGLFDYDGIIGSMNFVIDYDPEVLWFHNILDEKIINGFKRRFSSAKFILQIHSPTHEGPIFNFALNNKKLSQFDQLLVISQAHPRMYDNFELIPNVCPFVNFRQQFDQKLLIALTPSGSHIGRFSNKSLNNLHDLIPLISNNIKINFFYNTPQNEILEMRSNINLNIDDIKTGGFHQVSIEALCSGGIAINNADIFSLMAYAKSIYADELPPFVFCSSSMELLNKIKLYTIDKDILIEDTIKSRNYSLKYLNEKRLAKIILNKVSK